MRLLFLDQLAPEPGTLLEWAVSTTAPPRPDRTPPTSNQAIHLSADAPTTWLAATFDVAGPIDEAALQAAFEAWLPRHDALHCGFSATAASPAVDLYGDNDFELTPRPPQRVESTDDLREVLGGRLDAACVPFTFPPYFLGAISRAERSTVVCGFDHAVCDGWSITVAVTELDELYRAAHEEGPAGVARVAGGLPEAGSFLSYSVREAAAPTVAIGPSLRAWQDFLRAAGGDVPHFPIDLGVPAGALAPPGGDVRELLGAGAMTVLHRSARAKGFSVFAVLLSAVAHAAAKLDGRDHIDLIFPVHTRRQPRNHNTFGWLVANAPARIPVAADLVTTVPGADAAIRTGHRLAQVPAARVLAEMEGELRPRRRGVFSVSYTDYRYLPGGSRGALGTVLPRNSTHISRATPVDDVQLWFARTDDGLALRTRFPDTPIGRGVIEEFLGVLSDLVQSATSH